MREEEKYTHWDAMALHPRKTTQNRNKVILALDEPIDCNECPLHDISSMQGDKLCLASGKRWIETQNLGKKPEWCPLKPLPREACEHLIQGLDAIEKMKSVKARVVRETPHFEGIEE